LSRARPRLRCDSFGSVVLAVLPPQLSADWMMWIEIEVVTVRVCVPTGVRACVHVCVRVCVRMCLSVGGRTGKPYNLVYSTAGGVH
jgi:hypothetical protein